MLAENLRFAIVGAGAVGRQYARALRSLGARDLLAIDVSVDRLAEVETESGVPGVTMQDAAWDWGPNAVVVAVPVSLRIDVALEAARQGCHLFVAAPVGLGLDGVDELVASVRERALVSLVECSLRFHPGLRRMKALLDDGAIGVPHVASVVSGSPPPERQARHGNRPGDREPHASLTLRGIHEIDYTRWLLGAVTSVRAVAGTFGDQVTDPRNLVTMALSHETGVVSQVHLDGLSRREVRRCEVYGTGGMLRLDLLTGDLELTGQSGSHTFAPPEGWDPEEMFTDELRHFFACLLGEASPEQDLPSSAEALRVALTVLDSAERGERVVVG